MRLIDADELKKRLIGNRYGTKAIEYVIDDTPTVKAIPIEWIEKWQKKFYKVINGKNYYVGDGYDTAWDLLEDWEKENEESN